MSRGCVVSKEKSFAPYSHFVSGIGRRKIKKRVNREKRVRNSTNISLTSHSQFE